MPCSDLQQYSRAILLALLSSGGVVGCGLVLSVVLTLGETRMAFVEVCLAESDLVGAVGRGLAGCGLGPVLEGASGHDREKEADEKTI